MRLDACGCYDITEGPGHGVLFLNPGLLIDPFVCDLFEGLSLVTVASILMQT